MPHHRQWQRKYSTYVHLILLVLLIFFLSISHFIVFLSILGKSWSFFSTHSLSCFLLILFSFFLSFLLQFLPTHQSTYLSTYLPSYPPFFPPSFLFSFILHTYTPFFFSFLTSFFFSLLVDVYSRSRKAMRTRCYPVNFLRLFRLYLWTYRLWFG